MVDILAAGVIVDVDGRVVFGVLVDVEEVVLGFVVEVDFVDVVGVPVDIADEADVRVLDAVVEKIIPGLGVDVEEFFVTGVVLEVVVDEIDEVVAGVFFEVE